MIHADDSIGAQLRRNAVALISLVVAITGLGYNTWRNEATEANRNQRQAAFEVLLKLGELQQVVFHGHYDRNDELGNPRAGWAYILTVNDLSSVLAEPLPATMDELQVTWAAHWAQLGESQESADAILASIDSARAQTIELLQMLE